MWTLLFSLFTSGWSKLLPLLKTYWKQIAVVLVILCTVLYVSHLRSKVEKQAAVIEQQTVALQQAAEANKTLLNQVSVINATIDKWSDLSQSQMKDLAKLSDNLASQQKATNNKVDAILKGVKPKTCEQAIQYLIDGAKEFDK